MGRIFCNKKKCDLKNDLTLRRFLKGINSDKSQGRSEIKIRGIQLLKYYLNSHEHMKCKLMCEKDDPRIK